MRCLAFAGIALLFLEAALLLARDPCLGVADNLDYWRVADPAGIEVQPEPKQGYYVVCSYPVREAALGGFFSSPALMAWLSRPLGRGLGVPEGRFDLRQLGLFYWAAAAAVLAFALALGLRATSAFLLTWVLTDSGFLLFFNSLYADPALLLGLLGTVCFLPFAGFGERGKRGERGERGEPGAGSARGEAAALALLFAAAALAGFSKMQYSPFPLLLLAVAVLVLALKRDWPGPGRLVFLALLALPGLAGPWHFFRGSAPRFPDANAYNAVYGGIARVSSHPAAALAALGVPAAYRERPAEDYFAARVGPDDPVLPSLRRLSRVRLAGLYLGDPGAAWRTAESVARELWKPGTNPRGNFTRAESGRKRRVYEAPWQFSAWRSRCLGWLPPKAVWIFLGAVAGALVYRGARGRWDAQDTVWLFLLLWLSSQAAVAVLGEGFVNLHQHLLGARFALDLLLVLVLERALTALLGSAKLKMFFRF